MMRVFVSYDVDPAPLVDKLTAQGVTVCTARTSGPLSTTMSESNVILLVVTRAYAARVDRGDPMDRVLREFTIASTLAHKIVPVRFDSQTPRRWSERVRTVATRRPYVDLSTGVDDASVARVMSRCRDTVCRNVVSRLSSQSNKDTRPLRDRVDQVLTTLGDRKGESEHLGEVVDRLTLTLRGTTMSDTPLVERVRLLERELGL